VFNIKRNYSEWANCQELNSFYKLEQSHCLLFKYVSRNKATKRIIIKEAESTLRKLDYKCWLVGKNIELWTNEVISVSRDIINQEIIIWKRGKIQINFEGVPNQNSRISECLQ
jgi:hypothetical protein